MLYPNGSMPEMQATVAFKRFFEDKIDREIVSFHLGKADGDERSFYEILIDELARNIVNIDIVERILNKGMYRRSKVNFVEWFIGLSANRYIVSIKTHIQNDEEELHHINEQFLLKLKERITHYAELSDPLEEEEITNKFLMGRSS